MIQLKWPDMFNSNSTNLVYDKASATQDLKLLLQSEKGELWSDPGYGIRLRRFLYDQNSTYLISLIKEQIYEAIKKYIPQIFVPRDNITFTRDKTILYINIVYTYVTDGTSDTLKISLIQE